MCSELEELVVKSCQDYTDLVGNSMPLHVRNGSCHSQSLLVIPWGPRVVGPALVSREQQSSSFEAQKSSDVGSGILCHGRTDLRFKKLNSLRPKPSRIGIDAQNPKPFIPSPSFCQMQPRSRSPGRRQRSPLGSGLLALGEDLQLRVRLD